MRGMVGLELQMVCGSVPVLSMDASSVFHEHASSMLQAALDSSSKADSLFEYADDERVFAECQRSLSMGKDELFLARLREPELRHVKAMGATKRSAMLSLVLALALDKRGKLPELRVLLNQYDLNGPFSELIAEARHIQGDPSLPTAAAPAPKPPAGVGAESCEAHGVKVEMLSGGVPVLSMDKGSVFSETASWCLQLATQSMRKADSLYAYVGDAQILQECRRLGYSKEEVFVGRLTCEELPDAQGLKAVGTCGKRSVMLSLTVALLVHAHVKVETLIEDLCGYDPKLRKPITDLIQALHLGVRNGDRGDSRSSPAGLPRRIKSEPGSGWNASYDSDWGSEGWTSKPWTANGGGGGDWSWAAAPPAGKKQRLEEAALGSSGSLEAPSPQELRNRELRSKRFQGTLGSKAAQRVSVPEAVEGNAGTDDRPIEGSSSDLERPYVRLPRPCDVRREPVLKESFKMVCAKWAQSRDWVYAGEMLQSIRQDLYLQMIRTPFTVEVYEFSGRLALEVGDFKQFDQCSTRLEHLHQDASIGAAEHKSEFLAYRLLYLALLGDNLQMSVFLAKHGQALRTAVDDGQPHAVYAWRLRRQLALGCLPAVCKAARGSAPLPEASIVKHLVTQLLEAARLRQLVALCKACKPSASEAFLRRLLPGLTATNGSAPYGGLPLVASKNNPAVLDLQETAVEASRLLGGQRTPAAGGVVRVRLGEASTEHIRGFVRSAGGPG